MSNKEFNPSFYEEDTREDLLGHIKYYMEYKHILIECLRNAPNLPEPYALCKLGKSRAGKFPEDWEKGKEMQRELGVEIIPPNTECEIGAGLWNRLTSGAWRIK